LVLILRDRANKRRVTKSGAFVGATLSLLIENALAIFLPSGVIPKTLAALMGQALNRLCRVTTLRSSCLAGQKNSPRRANPINVSRPNLHQIREYL